MRHDYVLILGHSIFLLFSSVLQRAKNGYLLVGVEDKSLPKFLNKNLLNNTFINHFPF